MLAELETSYQSFFSAPDFSVWQVGMGFRAALPEHLERASSANTTVMTQDNALVISLLSYGAQVWSPDIINIEIERALANLLNRKQRACMRLVVGACNSILINGLLILQLTFCGVCARFLVRLRLGYWVVEVNRPHGRECAARYQRAVYLHRENI